MTPNYFTDFVGEEKVKAKLVLAIAVAKQRGEALGHVLLLGPPGSGQATVAGIIAKAMGATIKRTEGPAIQNADNLAGLLTKLEKGDVLFIEEIHRLPKAMEEYLCPALKDFRTFLPLDQGGYTRPFRLNLRPFTLIGSAPSRGQLSPNLLSQFSIVEALGD